jgi:hypothetical protein
MIDKLEMIFEYFRVRRSAMSNAGEQLMRNILTSENKNGLEQSEPFF